MRKVHRFLENLYHSFVMRHGVELSQAGTTFRVWAPKHPSLQLHLEGREFPMEPDSEGGFSLFRPGVAAGATYGYRFEDGRLRPDPASRRQPQRVHALSAVFDPKAFPWSDGGWTGLPLESLVFYELHVGTFTEEGTLAAAARHQPDMASLGNTSVELMPLQPF